ncbi:MAG: 16S rRNA processing protein RimM [Clostridiales bacterium]|jgi:16S rRNA processing protein RimM|nr:16S rRNA processing protein RimM [Clostridiales bacterium]
METLRLGKVTNSVGLKGEIRVYPYTDYKEKFEEIEYVLIDNEKLLIEGVRYIKGLAILKLNGIDNRTDAERFKDKDLFIYRKDAPPLPEDTYYVKDLIGLCVEDEDGKKLGNIIDVIIGSAQDLYVVEPTDGGKAFMIPAVGEFILLIDLDKQIMKVHLIEGLITL